MDIRDRIVEFKRIRVDALQDHAGNWRRHPQFQKDALRGVLKEVGIAGALTAYISERQGGLTLIDGHLRKGDFPDVEWPVLLLDVNDEEADLLLATMDPMAALAQADAEQLGALLEGIKTEDEALKEMLAGLEFEAQLGDGEEVVMLDQAVQLKPPREYVLVMCENDGELDELRRLLDLCPVRRGGYKEKSQYNVTGWQRVIEAGDLIGRLAGANSNT